MENNVTMADGSIDSVPKRPPATSSAQLATYETLEEDNNIDMDHNNHNDSYMDEDDDIQQEIENIIKIQPPSSSSSSSLQNPNQANISNYDSNQEHGNDDDDDVDDDDDDEDGDDNEDDNDEDDDFSPSFEDEEISEQYIQNESPQSYVEHNILDKRDPFVVQEDDDDNNVDGGGMIKKIKICNNKDQQKTEAVVVAEHPQKPDKSLKPQKKITEMTKQQLQSIQQQPRSSTPMSREYLALQRSVNESKILTEFVTDTANEKPRKLRTKDLANTSTSSATDHSYSSTIRKTTQISPEKSDATTQDTISSISPSSQNKRHYSKRYVPLKNDESDADTSANLRPRSRSKSMHTSEFNLLGSGSNKKLKKWPSEERLHKRTNMRSENSEFVQKQMDFLQRVIHSCETPHSRSRSRSKSNESRTARSRSRGRKSPASAIDSSGGGSGGGVVGEASSNTSVGNQQKSHRTPGKERISRRNKYESARDNDESHTMIESMEHPDDVSLNGSSSAIADTNITSTVADFDAIDAQLKSVWQLPPKPGSDSFCWKCHESKVNLSCSKCTRTFHAACAKMYKVNDSTWICPECTTVDNMLINSKRSRRNELSVDLLSQLLSFALKRMRYAKGHYDFLMPYEETTIYNKYILNPVTLTKLQTKIEMKEYRCAEELVNESKWMLHNAFILSGGSNTKTVMAAKAILKICRQEANEIETCPECYLNANTKTDWFVDICSQPHLLLWAKLKGFPYWPAKAMSTSQHSLVNVRFFGEHDRAFVPLKDCYLYSEQDPNTATGKRAAKELADCIKEVQEHIEKIRSKVGAFKYASFKTPYDPSDEITQLEEMMPGVQEFIKKQQILNVKPSLQFKIYKTADNNLSIVHKATTTPELQPSGTSSGIILYDVMEEKKKKNSVSEVEELHNMEDINIPQLPLPLAPPPKYEVVSKVSSEDSSNSSKLSTVILKRKSVNGEAKKLAEDDAVELPLPKMTKIEEHLPLETPVETIKISPKRKSETQPIVEKPKATKHMKSEPKIPVITIKTNLTKEPIMVTKTNELNKSAMIVIPKDAAAGTKLSVQQQNDGNIGADSINSQKVVENLVKNKQGVTIKKISKDLSDENNKTINSKESVTAATKSSTPETAKDKMNKQKKVDEEKARENQKVNNILKGLVPFVEVKKEVLSDNEEHRTVKPEIPKVVVINKESASQQTNKISPTPPRITAATNTATSKPSPTSKQHITSNESLLPKEAITTNIQSNNQSANNSSDKQKQPTPPLITQVKEEVFSDEEDPTNNSNRDNSNIKSLSTATDKRNLAIHPTEVRVVGDTTIQKLSCKQNQQTSSSSSYAIASTSQAQNNNNNNNNNNNSKRPSLKGVPYGPLPASAFPKSAVSRTFQQTDMVGGIQPRAKKSFPLSSPPVEKLGRPPNVINLNNTAQIILNSTSTTNSHLDPKKSMAKTTMVAIPVDVATSRVTTCSVGTLIGSIPVPPLTAVSKILPHNTSTFNSMVRNPSIITLSGTSSSSTTASVMTPTNKISIAVALTSTTSSRSSPITVATSTVPTAPSPSSLSSQPPPPVNQTNPLTMSTPPPLAGLSGSTLSTSQINGLTDTNAALPTIQTSTSALTPQQSSTDTHLLGGLVTPSLASAITDVICKGPPKLAVRPNGPLQSEGYPMFPSQAGPVCKRLVENVHKLTDFFISVVEDTMGEMAQGDDASLQAKITLLTMEMERSKQAYEQEIAELKRTSDLMLCEMRKSMENEKTRLAIDIRKQCEAERIRSIEETKRKQWCANCFREANFYCCWNTSYCDYPCQQLHWSRHAHTCAQTRSCGGNDTTSAGSSNNLNQQSELRHHATKSNSTTSLNSSANAAKASAPTTMNHKREKIVIKSNSNHIMSSSMSPSAASTSASRTNTEVLKLPTNTYLRPVTSSGVNNQTLRCNTTYSIPMQRFNIPLPITTPANTISPQTFTIVQQGNSWVMSGSGNVNNSSVGNNSTTSSATIAAPIVSVPQITTQSRTVTGAGTLVTNKSPKTQIRYH